MRRINLIINTTLYNTKEKETLLCLIHAISKSILHKYTCKISLYLIVSDIHLAEFQYARHRNDVSTSNGYEARTNLQDIF